MTSQSPEWLCRQIVERAPDAMIVADPEGSIRLWNPGAETLFGYTAEEALGRSLDLIIPERLRARHWEGFRRAMAAGTTKYGRELLGVPAIRRDGSRFSLEFSVALLKGPGGEVIGVAAIMRDVTERFQEQQQLRKRLAALEAGAASPG